MTLQETFPSRFHSQDRAPRFGLWGFHARLPARTLYQVAIWQRGESGPIFQWTLANIFLLHKITLVWLSGSQSRACNFDHCLKPEFMTRRNGCVCRQHMNMLGWYLHKLQQHLCQHMPPILKLNEQVIQMTYKVKWQQRDCQAGVCVWIQCVSHQRLLPSGTVWGNAAEHIL